MSICEHGIGGGHCDQCLTDGMKARIKELEAERVLFVQSANDDDETIAIQAERVEHLETALARIADGAGGMSYEWVVGRVKDALYPRQIYQADPIAPALNPLNAEAMTRESGSGQVAEEVGCNPRVNDARQAGVSSASPTAQETPKPDYYYQGVGTTYKAGKDPEVTCKHCNKTFLCDSMDAACRLCGEWFSDERIKKYGSNKKQAAQVCTHGPGLSCSNCHLGRNFVTSKANEEGEK